MSRKSSETLRSFDESIYTQQAEDDASLVSVTDRGGQRLHRYQDVDRKRQLPEQLGPRTIRSISIGATIGTGVFIGIGSSLRQVGPAGTLISYIIAGSVFWGMVVSTSEMIAWLPNVGGLIGISSLYLDPAFGFALGWIEWYNWVLGVPSQLSAAVVLIAPYVPTGQFSLNQLRYMIAGGLLLISVIVNCAPLRGYRSVVWTMSLFKRLAILCLVITCVVITFHSWRFKERAFFEYWKWENHPFAIKDPGSNLGGAIVTMLNGVSLVRIRKKHLRSGFEFFARLRTLTPDQTFQSSSREGSETAVRTHLDRSNSCFIKFSDCRLSSTPLSSCFRPAKHLVDVAGRPDLSLASPFIIAFEDSIGGKFGKHLPLILTCIFGISAWSASVCVVFIASRYLFFLAQCGQAPVFLQRGYIELRNFGHQHIIFPWTSLAVSVMVGAMVFMTFTSAIDVFHYLSSLSAVAGPLAWIIMLTTYERWYRAISIQAEREPEVRDRLNETIKKYRNPLQPWLARYSLTVLVMLILSKGWLLLSGHQIVLANDVDSKPNVTQTSFDAAFLATLIPIPIFIVLVIWYKLVFRSSVTDLNSMPPIREILSVEGGVDEDLKAPVP